MFVSQTFDRISMYVHSTHRNDAMLIFLKLFLMLIVPSSPSDQAWLWIDAYHQDNLDLSETQQKINLITRIILIIPQRRSPSLCWQGPRPASSSSSNHQRLAKVIIFFDFYLHFLHYIKSKFIILNFTFVSDLFKFSRLSDSRENALLPGLQYVVEPVIKFI